MHCLAKIFCHLDLTKKIGMSLQLDNYNTGDYHSSGNKLFNPIWCNYLLSKEMQKLLKTVVFFLITEK